MKHDCCSKLGHGWLIKPVYINVSRLISSCEKESIETNEFSRISTRICREEFERYPRYIYIYAAPSDALTFHRGNHDSQRLTILYYGGATSRFETRANDYYQIMYCIRSQCSLNSFSTVFIRMNSIVNWNW